MRTAELIRTATPHVCAAMKLDETGTRRRIPICIYRYRLHRVILHPELPPD